MRGNLREGETMKKLLPLMLFGLILTSFAVLVANVKATHNPMVWIYDKDGNPRDEFALGEGVRIVVYDSAYFTLKVYDPDGDMRFFDISAPGLYDTGVRYDLTDKIGPWVIEVRDTRCKFAVAMYNTIPEAAFGILGVLAACFTGLGLKSIRAKKEV